MLDIHGRTYRAYRRYRASGLRAKDALCIARGDDTPLEWDWSGETGTIEREGFTLKLTWQYDPYADDSWVGTFTDEWSEGAISNRDSETSSYFKWFVPETTVRDHVEWLNGKGGMSKACAWEKAREYVERDMTEAREHTEYVVTVTAWREGVELGGDSLGGVSFDDSSPRDRDQQVEEVASEHGMVDTAISEARATLERLKATT